MLAVLKLIPTEGKELAYTEWTQHSFSKKIKSLAEKKKTGWKGLQYAATFCLHPY